MRCGEEEEESRALIIERQETGGHMGGWAIPQQLYSRAAFHSPNPLLSLVNYGTQGLTGGFHLILGKNSVGVSLISEGT
ncbi:hypothetical protein Hanom_Chr14g01316761 [Helianthus anomalus]